MVEDDEEDESQVGATFFFHFSGYHLQYQQRLANYIHSQVLITENDTEAYVLRLGLGLANSTCTTCSSIHPPP